MTLLEGTSLLEVPFNQLQNVLTNLLTNVKIVYSSSKGTVNAQQL